MGSKESVYLPLKIDWPPVPALKPGSSMWSATFVIKWPCYLTVKLLFTFATQKWKGYNVVTLEYVYTFIETTCDTYCMSVAILLVFISLKHENLSSLESIIRISNSKLRTISEEKNSHFTATFQAHRKCTWSSKHRF